MVGDTAVHQVAVPPVDRRKDSWNGRAGHHCIEYLAARQANLTPSENVGGYDVERNPSLLEALELEVFDKQVAQPTVRDEVPAGAEEAQKSSQRVKRENLTPPDLVPDLCELISGRRSERPRSDKGPRLRIELRESIRAR